MNVSLVLLKKDGTTKSFKLPSTVTSIGRRQDCDFCLPLSMVSRRHCEISVSKDQVWVRDLGSRNGTFLNGQRIDETRAKAGDILQIGPVSFVLQIDGVPSDFTGYRDKLRQMPDQTAVSNGAETLANVKPVSADASDSLADKIQTNPTASTGR